MKINERWEELQAESHANIQSRKGIINRQTRSIQTEGHFGDIKENGCFFRVRKNNKEKIKGRGEEETLGEIDVIKHRIPDGFFFFALQRGKIAISRQSPTRLLL